MLCASLSWCGPGVGDLRVVASWDVVPSPCLTSLGEGVQGCGALVRRELEDMGVAHCGEKAVDLVSSVTSPVCDRWATELPCVSTPVSANR